MQRRLGKARGRVSHEGMRLLPGGSFVMGSMHFYPEERPLRRASVDAFWIDQAPVTNAQFARFVSETRYLTVAEAAPDPRDYPGLDPALAVPGSLVFHPPSELVPLYDHSAWWRFVPGAQWRHPFGPESDLEGRDDHPVVQVAYADAEAYARWAGKSLPTEAEWEFAARGGLVDAEYAWGSELAPDGEILANYWLGEFPHSTAKPNGDWGTTPIGRYPANGFGLSDMIGNVWEWTRDWYGSPIASNSGCCQIANPRGAKLHDSYEPGAEVRIGRKVLKGGSHLCAVNYCQRYRPAARHPQAIDSATSHIGFRCVSRRGVA